MKTPHSDPGTNGAESQGDPTRVYEQTRRVGREARELAGDLGALGGEVETFLRRQVEARPYGTLLTAAGAGYVLGGGVPPWLIRLGLAAGGRYLMGYVLREVLAGAAAGEPPPVPPNPME